MLQFSDSVFCPVCKENFVHLVALRCLPAGDKKNGLAEITRSGILFNPGVQPDGRGVLVSVEFHCESSHRFEISYHFHKGTTFVETKVLERREGFSGAIWRD